MRLLFFIMLLLFAATVSADDTVIFHSKKTKQKSPATQIKLHLPRLLKPFVPVMIVDDDNDDENDVVDIQVAYRRPDLVENSELPLSDYVQLRLAHARRLALIKYQEVWG